MSHRDHERAEEWRSLRLCRQVEESLCIALAGCGDEILASMGVESVVPAPDAGHLLVTVSFSVRPIPDPVEALGRLHRATGWLREQVAGAISRKRVPELAFRFASPEEAGA